MPTFKVTFVVTVSTVIEAGNEEEARGIAIDMNTDFMDIEDERIEDVYPCDDQGNPIAE